MKTPRLAWGGASVALLALLAGTIANEPNPPTPEVAPGPAAATAAESRPVEVVVPALIAVAQARAIPPASEPAGSALDRAAIRPTVATATATVAPGTATAGMVVAIDPETGQLGMPTPEQMAELLDAQAAAEIEGLNHSSDGLVQIQHPDGHVTLRTGGRFMEFAIARIGPDGRVTYDCVSSHEALKHALEALAPKPVALEDR